MKGVLVEMICNHRVRVGILTSFLLAVILPSVTVCQPAAISSTAISPAAISPATISPATISPATISPSAISPSAIKKFLQMFGRIFRKAPKPKKIPKIPGRIPGRPKTPNWPGRPIPRRIPLPQRGEQLLAKTKSAVYAAKSAINLIPNGTPHAARILTKVWQVSQEKIAAAAEKMKSPDLSERERNKVERELENLLEEQQKIEELAQKYG